MRGFEKPAVERRVGTVLGPADRQQPIVLDRLVAADEAGRELAVGVLDEFLVDLHLILGGDHLVMRLEMLLAAPLRVRVLGEELRRQHLAVPVDDDAQAVGATRSPDHRLPTVPLFEHQQFDERATETDAAREPVAGEIGDRDLGLDRPGGRSARPKREPSPFARGPAARCCRWRPGDPCSSRSCSRLCAPRECR